VSSLNPYQSPAATLAGEKTETVTLFAASSRLGRARYIAYSLALFALLGFGAVFLATFAGPGGLIFWIGAWVLLIVLLFLLTIQRCHDLNASGWLSLLLLLPPLGVIFVVAPGSATSNRYGAPPPRNSRLVLGVAWLLPVLVIISMIQWYRMVS
jgi:uncharacterized membrane protein YhaH (DUF805 family)